jgi:hypothetical protein
MKKDIWFWLMLAVAIFEDVVHGWGWFVMHISVTEVHFWAWMLWTCILLILTLITPKGKTKDAK